MKPTVGRIVHFYTSHEPDQVRAQGNGPYAAIVTAVRPGVVDLQIFGVSPQADRRFGVVELQPEATVPPASYWTWPAREGGI